MSKLSIYLAGRLNCAEEFHQLKTRWPEFDLVSSWVEKIYTSKMEDSWQNAMINWPINIIEAAGADVTLVWGRNESLRGALVEAGAALARGKTILLVGESESFGTWRYHPSCFLVGDLEEARQWLTRFDAKRARDGE